MESDKRPVSSPNQPTPKRVVGDIISFVEKLRSPKRVVDDIISFVEKLRSPKRVVDDIISFVEKLRLSGQIVPLHIFNDNYH